MQRDAYGSLTRFPNGRKVYLRITQQNGHVLHENVMEFFFQGYKARRLALMTYTAGQDPRLPRLPRDIVVPSFESLLRIHQPHFAYQLLPLLSADVETFGVLQSICSASGSPFKLEDRIEAGTFHLRFLPLCHGRDKVCEFMKDDTAPSELLVPAASRQLPVNAVSFQGVLFRERGLFPHSSHSGEASTPARLGPAALLLTTHETCSESVIHKRAIMTRFFQSPLYTEMHSNMALNALVQSAPLQWHVMAFKRRVGGIKTPSELRMRAQLLQKARQHNIVLYERVDEGVYDYVH